MDQVLSFVHQQEAEPRGLMREFHNIALSTYKRILDRLECKPLEYHPKVR